MKSYLITFNYSLKKVTKIESNLISQHLDGLLNSPYSFASTSHFIFTFSLSFSIVLGATIVGFKKHGLEFFSLLVPAGCPLALLRAPGEASVFIKIKSYLSYIYDRGRIHDVRRGYSRLEMLITFLDWVAEYKRVLCSGLPHKEKHLNGNRHVEANKPDTYECQEAAEDILSRIYRYLCNLALEYGNRFLCCHKITHSLYTKSLRGRGLRSKQAAKSIRTINVTSKQPRDRTASILHLDMRRRSFHSSACTKGNSKTSLKVETLDCNQEKAADKVKPAGVAKRVGVTTIVRKRLEQNKIVNQKYQYVLKEIADPNFLIACYEEIRGKPVNMTKAVDKVTLDGIDFG